MMFNGTCLKGVVSPIGVIIALGLVLLAGLAITDMDIIPLSFFPTALIVDPDPSCQPGELVSPLYGTFECKLSGAAKTEPVTNSRWCGIYLCYDVNCAESMTKPTGIDCRFYLTTLGTMISPTPTLTDSRCPTQGACGILVPSGQSVTITVNPAFGVTPAIEKVYEYQYLHYEDWFGRKYNYEAGCGLTSSNLGFGNYSVLPIENKNKILKLTEVINTVIAYDSFPYTFNMVEYQGGFYTCRSTGQTRSLYSIKQYNAGQFYCYYYEDAFYKNVECCPGEERIDGATCAPDLTWTTSQSGTGCCSGNICTDLKCPGQGGWDWIGWVIGQPVKSYSCNSLTGLCDLKQSTPAQCNPNTGVPCLPTQFCDPTDFTCKNQPQVNPTCLEAGFECCTPGMFDYVRDIRTCEQAGKIGHVCVNGYCYPQSDPSNCNHNGVCDLILGENEVLCPEDCGGKTMMQILMDFFVTFVIAFIVALVIIFILSLFIPFFRGALKNPGKLIGIAAIIALIISFFFAVPLASISGGLI